MYIVLLIRMRIITLIIRIVLMYVSYISFDNDIMSEDCQHYHFYEYSHRIRSSPYLPSSCSIWCIDEEIFQEKSEQ